MSNILSIQIWDKGFESLIKKIIIECRDIKKNRLISASDAHVLVSAKRNNEFGKVLNNFYLNVPDGMPSVWIGRLKGAKEMERCYGPDLFREVMIHTSSMGVNHFLCGGKEGIVEKLKKVCEKKFKNGNICGIYSPPFYELNEKEIKNIAEKVNEGNTNILWIGLSSPKQHFFAHRISKYTNVNFIITIGAAFDFHTDNVKQAPKYVQISGFEWLFRVIMEPKRLLKRYIKVVPLFIYYSLKDLLRKE